MSGTSSGGAHGAPQRPNELMMILNYVLAYDVRIGVTGQPVQHRPSDSPLPREVVIQAMHQLRKMAPDVMDAAERRQEQPTAVDHHQV